MSFSQLEFSVRRASRRNPLAIFVMHIITASFLRSLEPRRHSAQHLFKLTVYARHDPLILIWGCTNALCGWLRNDRKMGRARDKDEDEERG